MKWFDDTADARAEEVSAMTSYDVTHRSEYLNQCIGGVKFSMTGQTMSANTRSKMSASKIGRPSNHKGRLHSTETKNKISTKQKGRLVSDETRSKLLDSHQEGLYITPLGAFKSLREASIDHNCCQNTINRRCKSTKPQFKDWSFTPINCDKS